MAAKKKIRRRAFTVFSDRFRDRVCRGNVSKPIIIICKQRKKIQNRGSIWTVRVQKQGERIHGVRTVQTDDSGDSRGKQAGDVDDTRRHNGRQAIFNARKSCAVQEV